MCQVVHGIDALKLVVKVRHEVCRQVELKRFVRKEAKRGRQTIWRAVNELWRQGFPVALAAKITFDAKWLDSLVAASQQIIAGILCGSERLFNLRFECLGCWH